MIIPENTTVDTGNDTVMQTYGLRAFSRNDRPIVQNLGPGTLYLSTTGTNVDTVGLALPINAVYELPAVLMEGAGRIYLRATGVGGCDVRVINVG
jgi:hypothetical protein